ncbi:MAG: helix-turn-helix domain-containing protein [Oscillibacter sp.]|jgi:predicted site-specific integrase-resolvase|nr:helix-turn-helix domain-containing protein [Oscillibacter sp.]
MDEPVCEIRLYTPEQVADLLHVSIQTIWKWDRQGRIHSINLAGNRIKRYRHKDIAEFLDRMDGRKAKDILSHKS